jgi:group I intron endonuclease
MLFKHSDTILLDIKTSGIYKIYFTDCPEIFYIGASKNIRSRFKDHTNDLLANRHKSKKFQDNFNVYGVESLLFEVLELVHGNYDLRSRENFYLNSYSQDFLYNKEKFSNICLSNAKKEYAPRPSQSLTMQGNQNKKGKLHSDITKERMSKAKKGGIVSKAGRKNISISKLGELHPRTSLNSAIVYKIKHTISSENLTLKQVADLFNVSHNVVRHISSGHCWDHVNYP